MSGPSVIGIGVDQPARAITRAEGLALARRANLDADRDRLESLYDQADVDSRGVAVAPQRMLELSCVNGVQQGPSTAKRQSEYEDAAGPMAARAAERALAEAGVGAGSVTHLVTVSCTGAGSPGLDLELIERIGLRADTARTHIGFMGCHGAINAMRVARSFAASEAEAIVLVVCCEVCSAHYRVGPAPSDQLVANAIFADGAAALVVACRGGWLAIRDTSSAVIPDTGELMSWSIGDQGYEMRLSPRVPAIIRREIGAWADAWLARSSLLRVDVSGWAVHPGGRDILNAVELGLELSEDKLVASRRVLRERGNMSSGSVVWVLDELMRRGAHGPIVVLAFGPGLCVEAALLDASARET